MNYPNVIHIIISLGVGGAELMLRRLAVAQRPTTVVSLKDIGPVGHMLQADGVEVIELGLRGIWDLPRVLFATQRVLDDRRPDVVQTWMVHADLIGGLAARMAGIRAVIWGVRTTEFGGTSRGTRQIRWLCARLSGWVPAAIACAAEASRRSHIAIGYDASHMVVIPNGFDVDQFKPDPERRQRMRASLGLGESDIVIGNVGRWNDAKDHPNFVRAADMLQAGWSADRPGTLRFAMVGRGVDGQNAVLDEALAATACRDRYLLLGERNDVPDLLQAFDLFCLSSRTEGFPNVVGEAMSSGVPCVVTDVGDAAMLVGDTGWVVRKEDPVALSTALHAAATESADLHDQRAKKARQRIVDEYSMTRACQRFSELQASVARSHGSDTYKN
ncbi:glycosyltransferase family 4 protein [Leptothrix discophora]|uniref:Glycosyltransferase n=1 Tax=Leptothrix discophora TaxID=89 RepID=A0ABT9G0A1_LEPDI|nr:glycosyltransferase [Leptothrix discophora]MDP4299850.1 glycosyltransferase [Leptothrix discophora]